MHARQHWIQKRSLGRLALALLVSLLGTQALAQQLAAEQVLIVAGAKTDLGMLTPHAGQQGGDAFLAYNLYNGLVTYPTNLAAQELGEYGPDLAHSWDVSEDGRTWTFYLIEGVQFHHGYGELTAEDVVHTYSVLNHDSLWCINAAQFRDLEVEAVDRYTVAITTPVPNALLLRSVADFACGPVVSKVAVEELGTVAWQTNPRGATGPFQFAEYVERERVVLERNEAYFKQLPTLDRIELRYMDRTSAELALRQGTVHLLIEGEQDEAWLRRMQGHGLDTFTVTTGSILVMFLNAQVAPFDDIRVRQAFHHAIDSSEIIDFLFGPSIAVPMKGPVPGFFYGGTDDVREYPYDPERARELLAEAGYPNGLSVTAINSEAASYVRPGLAIQEQLALVGIELEYQFLAHASFHTAIREGAGTAIVYSATRPPFADYLMEQFYHSSAIVTTPTGITNFVGYDKVDDLIVAARVEIDPERQVELYRQASRQIMEDAVVVPIAVRFWPWAKVPFFDMDIDLTSDVFTPDPGLRLGPNARLLAN